MHPLPYRSMPVTLEEKRRLRWPRGLRWVRRAALHESRAYRIVAFLASVVGGSSASAASVTAGGAWWVLFGLFVYLVGIALAAYAMDYRDDFKEILQVELAMRRTRKGGSKP